MIAAGCLWFLDAWLWLKGCSGRKAWAQGTAARNGAACHLVADGGSGCSEWNIYRSSLSSHYIFLQFHSFKWQPLAVATWVEHTYICNVCEDESRDWFYHRILFELQQARNLCNFCGLVAALHCPPSLLRISWLILPLRRSISAFEMGIPLGPGQLPRQQMLRKVGVATCRRCNSSFPGWIVHSQVMEKKAPLIKLKVCPTWLTSI